jgi:hypothetical protein
MAQVAAQAVQGAVQQAVQQNVQQPMNSQPMQQQMAAPVQAQAAAPANSQAVSSQAIVPPAPTAEMLALAASVVRGQAAAAEAQANLAVMPAHRAEEAISRFDEEVEQQQQQAQVQAAPVAMPMSAQVSAQAQSLQTPSVSQGAEMSELARARALAQRLGITNLTDDEYDVPAYLRRQQEREL